MTVIFDGLERKSTMDVVGALAGHKAGRLVLVHVREDAERARGFAPGSQHLPLGQLKQRLGELPTDLPSRSSARAAAARQWPPRPRAARAWTPTTSPVA